MPADQRSAGFAETCVVKGVYHKEIATSSSQYNTLEYHEYIETILRENPETDGIFASSDLIAAQVIQVCAKLKLTIPDQIKIIGFDDVNIASLTTPRITTIHQPIKEMSKLSIELLIRACEGKMVPSRTTLPVCLIKRETT
jgi:LacI family sucrose operon transcriptional repressor